MNSQSFLFKCLAFYGNHLQHRGNERVLDWLRRVTHADVDEELEVERRGRRWILNPSDFVRADVFWSGYKDRWDVWHLERLLPRDAVLVDVGANFGYYTVELTTALGPGARAIAFEPFPQNCERLERHVRMNDLTKRVRVLPFALSDASGSLTMHLRQGGNTGSAQLGGGEGLTIRAARLDELWPELGYERLDFIKIDVEGHEIRVLRGAQRMISEHKPMMLIEIDPPRLKEGGASSTELVEMLRDLRYDLFRSRRRELVSVDSCDEAGVIFNAFCMPRGRSPL
jgi:FkbM family methyltransferase